MPQTTQYPRFPRWEYHKYIPPIVFAPPPPLPPHVGGGSGWGPETQPPRPQFPPKGKAKAEF